jgi:integrase
MPVTAIRKVAATEPSAQPDAARKAEKIVPANQKAIDALLPNSDKWKVEGIPGLYVRCRAKTKSFYVQRRVNGELILETLGEMSLKDAKERAMRTWGRLKQKPASGLPSFSKAFEDYMEQTELAAATITNYRLNFDTYLGDWHDRSIRDIGTDREGLRSLHQRIKKNHGEAKANQIRRLLSAVYNWHREGSNDDTLPEFPKKTMPISTLPARDWAYSDTELRAWWYAVEEKDGERIERGVKTLSPIKRTYWLTSLLTGARPASIENLKWTDIGTDADFDKRTIHFRITKGDRPYTVPMCDALYQILIAYRDGGHVPPSEWVFPSDRNESGHLTNVKNEKEGVSAKYHLRHTFRTTLTGLGVTGDQIRLLMGHSLGHDPSLGYISAALVIEPLRPIVNALAEHYLKTLGVEAGELLS